VRWGANLPAKRSLSKFEHTLTDSSNPKKQSSAFLTVIDNNEDNCKAADKMGALAISSVEDETEVYTEKLYTLYFQLLTKN
jgi:hypothetical protein